ncbi:MAG: hypothetical protein CME70_10925 [Halobacteriovorax sp.]|nr:hypothetical protein [Halobacteriovorax sp.]|tara:strand:+ start:39884 stop:40906 length:1023 start_codon:yes stop_codon:yes gene_type:complete
MTNDIVKYLELFKTYYKRSAHQICFDQNDDCSERIIRSHSIQNSFILDQIEVDNHLSIIDYASNGKIQFKKIGRNNASTFTGFCSHHDSSIFAPIDFNQASNISNITPEQFVLFYYRTLCREYWSKLNAIKVFNIMSKASKEKDIDTLLKIYPFLKTEKSINWDFLNGEILEMALLGQSMGAEDVEPYFESLRYQIKNSKYHHTKGIHFVIPSKASQFAVSSFISPVCDFDGNKRNNFASKTIHFIGLNIFPHNNDTQVIITWHRKSNYDCLGEQLEKMDTAEKEIQLSKFVLAHSENIVFSPDFISNLDQDRTNKIEKIFTGTTMELFKLSDYEDVSLF